MAYPEEIGKRVGDKYGSMVNKEELVSIPKAKSSLIGMGLDASDPIIKQLDEALDKSNGNNNITVQGLLDIVERNGMNVVTPESPEVDFSDIDGMEDFSPEEEEKLAKQGVLEEGPASEAINKDPLANLDESLSKLDESEKGKKEEKKPEDLEAEENKAEKEEAKEGETLDVPPKPDEEKTEFDYLIKDLEHSIDRDQKAQQRRVEDIITQGHKTIFDIDNRASPSNPSVIDLAAYAFGWNSRAKQKERAEENIKQELMALNSENNETMAAKQLLGNSIDQVNDSIGLMSIRMDMLENEKDPAKRDDLKAEIKTFMEVTSDGTMKDILKHAQNEKISPEFRSDLKDTLANHKECMAKMGKSSDKELQKIAQEAIKAFLDLLKAFGKKGKKDPVFEKENTNDGPNGP